MGGSFFWWAFLLVGLLGPYTFPYLWRRTKPKEAPTEQFSTNHWSIYGNWSGWPGSPVMTQYTAWSAGTSKVPSEGHPTPRRATLGCTKCTILQNSVLHHNPQRDPSLLFLTIHSSLNWNYPLCEFPPWNGVRNKQKCFRQAGGSFMGTFGCLLA